MKLMNRMQEGRAAEREIDMMYELTKQIEGHTICALGDAAAWPVQGLLQKFRPQIVERIREFEAKHGPVAYGGRLVSEKGDLPSIAWPENTIPGQSTLTL